MPVQQTRGVLLVVADGVGGNAGGEIASKLTLEFMSSSIEKVVAEENMSNGYNESWLASTLHYAITTANTQLIEQQKMNDALSEMATTVVALLIHNNKVALSHLGDSRCYQFKSPELTQLTEDHTVLQALLNQGKINQHEFAASPMHHMISKAVGPIEDIEITVSCFEFDQQAYYLLCSDGLTDCLTHDQIQHILMQNESAEKMVEKLIDSANNQGGFDNISVILVNKHK